MLILCPHSATDSLNGEYRYGISIRLEEKVRSTKKLVYLPPARAASDVGPLHAIRKNMIVTQND
jgi:hypothetical protein